MAFSEMFAKTRSKPANDAATPIPRATEVLGPWQKCPHCPASFRTEQCPTCVPTIRPAATATSEYVYVPEKTQTEIFRRKFLESMGGN
jgi:hypothetical protein